MLGTLKENIMWMGYDDGMLEYAPQPKLTEEATAIIRRIRPDILLSVDPGEWYERWHKSDHRMAAFNTIDAVRAAEFWLYFPNQKLQHGLQPYKVPEMYFFYPSPQEANYFVNIESVADLKFDAAAKQVSQFEPAVTNIGPTGSQRSGKRKERNAERATAQRRPLRGSIPLLDGIQPVLRDAGGERMSELALLGGKKAKKKAIPGLAALRQQGRQRVERSIGKPRMVAHAGHEDAGIRKSLREVSRSATWDRRDQRNGCPGSHHGCLGHHRGDEVIVPNFTFVATASAVLFAECLTCAG